MKPRRRRNKEFKYSRFIALLTVFLTIVNVLLFGYQVLREEFYDSDIEIYPNDEIQIGLNYGKFDFYQFIDIRNIGHGEGTISKMDSYVCFDGVGDSCFEVLNELKYYHSSNNNYFPLVEIHLKPGDIHSTYYEFQEDFSRRKRDSLSLLEYRVYQEFIEKKRHSDFYNYQPEQISAQTWNQLLNFIYTNDIKYLRPGKYFYLLSVYKNHENEPFYKKAYCFNISGLNMTLFRERLYSYFVKPAAPFQQFESSILVKLTEIHNKDSVEWLLSKSRNYNKDFKNDTTPVVPSGYKFPKTASEIPKIGARDGMLKRNQFVNQNYNEGILTLYTRTYAGAVVTILQEDSVVYIAQISSHVGEIPSCGQITKTGLSIAIQAGMYELDVYLRNLPSKIVRFPIYIEKQTCLKYNITWYNDSEGGRPSLQIEEYD